MLGSGCLKGCLGRATFLVLLAGAGYAAWRWGPEAQSLARSWLDRPPHTEEPVVSAELAQRTIARFDSLRGGAGPARIALGNAEVVSVLRYSLPGMIPETIAEPSVVMRDGGVTLSGSVPVEAFEGLADLGSAIGFLPDTLRLELQGSLTPLDERRAALVVHRVMASRFPLPDQMIAGVLEALGREPEEGLSLNALVVPLPSGLESAYILVDSLVLVADR